MDDKPIWMTPGTADPINQIKKDAETVETIHTALFNVYTDSSGQMGSSKDLSEFGMKFDKALDRVSAMSYAIGNLGETLNAIQKIYGDAQEKAIARAMLLPR